MAIVEAMKRLEGPAKGIMFRRKEVSRIPRISNTDPSFKHPEATFKQLECYKAHAKCPPLLTEQNALVE
jgi:hypothetical protein